MFLLLCPQLARIQTDSVAEQLKELFPHIALEIGVLLHLYALNMNHFIFIQSKYELYYYIYTG